MLSTAINKYVHSTLISRTTNAIDVRSLDYNITTKYDADSIFHYDSKLDLTKDRISLDAIYYCLHQPDDDCECHKPKKGMLEQAAREMDIDLSRLYLIGDKQKDVDKARNTSYNAILISSDDAEDSNYEYEVDADFVCRDIYTAVTWAIIYGYLGNVGNT